MKLSKIVIQFVAAIGMAVAIGAPTDDASAMRRGRSVRANRDHRNRSRRSHRRGGVGKKVGLGIGAAIGLGIVIDSIANSGRGHHGGHDVHRGHGGHGHNGHVDYRRPRRNNRQNGVRGGRYFVDASALNMRLKSDLKCGSLPRGARVYVDRVVSGNRAKIEVTREVSQYIDNSRCFGRSYVYVSRSYLVR